MSRKLALVGLLALVGIVLAVYWPRGDGNIGRRHPSEGAQAGEGGATGGASLAGRPGGAGAVLSPAEGGRGPINGVLRDVADGRGIGGVELVFLDATQQPMVERARRRTARDGRFAVALQEGRYRLQVEAAGYSLPQHVIPLIVAANARVAAWQILLQRQSVIKGRLLDGEGRGLSGRSVGLAGLRRGGVWQGRRPEKGAVTSDADGGFSLRVPAGLLRIAARAPRGWIPSRTLVIPPGREVRGLRFAPKADATLEGQVVGAGGAQIEQASVTLKGIAGRRLIRCERGGRFKATDLAPGEVLLAAHSKGMSAKQVTRAWLRSGQTSRVTLALQSMRILRGKVVGPQGRGVGGARLEARLLSPQGFARGLAPRSTTRSAVDGRFTLTVDARPRSIFASAPGPLRGYRHGIPPGTQQLLVPMHAPGELSARVLSRSGKPLDVLRLSLSEGGRRLRAWLLASKDGRFHLRDLTPGSVTLDVEAEGYESKRAVVSVRSGIASVIELKLEVAGRAAGEVRAPSGLPVIDAEVAVDGHPARTLTDFAGHFELEGLAPGSHTLRVTAPGHLAQRIEGVKISAGAKTSVPITTLRPAPGRADTPWRPTDTSELSRRKQ